MHNYWQPTNSKQSLALFSISPLETCEPNADFKLRMNGLQEEEGRLPSKKLTGQNGTKEAGLTEPRYFDTYVYEDMRALCVLDCQMLEM